MYKVVSFEVIITRLFTYFTMLLKTHAFYSYTIVLSIDISLAKITLVCLVSNPVCLDHKSRTPLPLDHMLLTENQDLAASLYRVPAPFKVTGDTKVLIRCLSDTILSLAESLIEDQC
jgi:hypothetical protein